MARMTLHTNRLLVLVFAALFSTGSALADKPPGAGHSKVEKREHKKKAPGPAGKARRAPGQLSRSPRDELRVEVRFGDRKRTVVHEYFAEQFRAGRCPPGLAKKRNGCMPPGQAKKWTVGRPLPREVIFYDLPPAVIVHLGPPPAGHRYVRVADDILLIAVGTAMVVDAIEDLGRI